MERNLTRKGILDRLIGVSFVLAGVYWVFDSLVQSLFLRRNIIEALFHPDPHEFWERLFLIGPFIFFAIVIRHLVSERTRAFAAVQEKERVLNTLMENLPGMAYRRRCDEEPTMEYLSQGCRELTGHASTELLHEAPRSYHDLIHPEDREVHREKVRAAIGNHRPFQFIYRIVTATGETKWVWEQGRRVSSPDGEAETQEGYICDITDQKTTEEALEKASNEWRLTFDTARDIILMLDRDYRIIKANRAAAQLLKKSYPDIIGRKCHALFHHDDNPITGCPLERMFRSGQHVQKELYFEEQGIWLRISVDPIHNETGKVIGAVYVARDITDIKELEENILEMNREWEGIFNILNDAITIHDADFNITLANKAAEEMLGLPFMEILGKKCYESYHATPCPPERCPSCRSLRTGNPTTTEIFEPHLNKFIEIKALPRCDADHRVIGLVHVVRDVTAHKKAEEEQQLLQDQLIQSRKMEAIGNLAGGVAHDFNNMLSTILGYNELSLDMLPEDHPVRKNHEIIQEAGEKAAALTRQLLAFDREQTLERTPVNLNGIVENTGKMLRRLIGKDIVLEFHPRGPIRKILANTGQIEQVLMNLAVHARDTMPDGGCLIIETVDRTIDAAFSHPQIKVTPGEYVLLTVSDTGAGIPREVQEKIFEPFFTTKERWRGTGLGLATVYGIVKQHGGWIWVYSEEGIGTAFKILLPAVLQETRQKEQESRPAFKEGTETILVVEDDPSIRQMIRNTLQTLGYRILSASCAEEALERCRRTEKKIDLVLSDVIMPGMNGVELAEKIIAILPSVPIILMSGYTDNFIAHHGVLDTGFAFLQKPVTPTLLTNKIREILDQDKAAEKTL